MKLDELQHFPLSKAFLCNDCQSVGNSNSWCPACASNNIIALTKWVASMVSTAKEQHE